MEKLGIAEALHKQYLSGKYCDLHIQVENTMFQAHSCVVAAASWVLEAILQSSGRKDPGMSRFAVQLHGVTPYSIATILPYLYTGCLDPDAFIDVNKRWEVLHAAKLYKLDDIVDQLESGLPGQAGVVVVQNEEVQTENTAAADGGENAIDSGEIKIILNNDHTTSDNVTEEESAASKEIREHVSQCVKYSKEHDILYCILCSEICTEPTQLIRHMLGHKQDTRRNTSRPERVAAMEAAVTLALENTGEPDGEAEEVTKDDDADYRQVTRKSKRKRKSAPKRSFTCTECGLSYTTKVYLLRHYSLRHPTLSFCRVCGHKFFSETELNDHIATHKGEENHDMDFDYEALKARRQASKKVFTCSLCVTTFLKKRELVQHQQVLHGIVKPLHVCTLCGKEFKEKASLRSHTRVHTGEKPYMCSFCGNSFADQKTWKDHERRHRGEKPFLCTTCGKSFTYRQSFTRHMKFHEGKRAFQCSFCGKAFVLRQNMKEHEKRHNK